MAKDKKVMEEEEVEETYLNYTINVTGDFIINIGENCEVKIMSGSPTPPVKPPGGGNG